MFHVMCLLFQYFVTCTTVVFSFCGPWPAGGCDFGAFHSTAQHHFLLYGAMVGGPDSDDRYQDDRAAYEYSEVTCDYNAGFQSAVAGKSD